MYSLLGGKIKYIGLIIFSVQSIYAQDIKFLQIEELFKLGIENSVSLKAANFQVSMASENKKTFQSMFYPHIEVGVKGGVSPFPTLFEGKGLSDPVPFKQFPLGTQMYPLSNWNQQYRLELVETIYQGRKIKHNVDKYTIQKEIALLDVERQTAEIKLILIRKYLDLMEAYKQQEVLEQHIQQATLQFKDMERLKSQGMSTENDLLRTQLLLTNYELAKEEVDNDIIINSQQLDIALGLDEHLLLQADTNLLSKSFDLLTYDEYVQHAYESYPELKIAQSSLLVLAKEKKLHQADYYPSLSLVSSAVLSRPAPPLMVPNNYFFLYGLSLSLTYDISSLYHNVHKVRSAQLLLDIQKTKEEQERRNIRSKINQYLIKHHEAKSRIRALDISLTQAIENYKVIWNKYQNQLATMTDILDANSVKLNAELQLLNAKVNSVYTYYQLLYFIGDL